MLRSTGTLNVLGLAPSVPRTDMMVSRSPGSCASMVSAIPSISHDRINMTCPPVSRAPR